MKSEDQVDFERMLAEFGLTPRDMRRLMQFPIDIVPFEDGVRATVERSPIDGYGLIATDRVIRGHWIAPVRVAGQLTPAGRYTNHAQHANSQVVATPLGDLHLIALREISAGEEITNDYRHNARVFYACLHHCRLSQVTRAMVQADMHAALRRLEETT